MTFSTGIWLPPAFIYLCLSLFRPGRWEEEGVPLARDIMAIWRPLNAACCASFFAYAAAFWTLRRGADAAGLHPPPPSAASRARPPATFALYSQSSSRYAAWATSLVYLQVAMQLVIATNHLTEIVFRPTPGGCAGEGPLACARSQLMAVALPMGLFLWLEAQLPLRLVVFPEVLRGAHHAAACALLSCLTHGRASLTLRSTLTWLAEAAALPVATCAVLGLCGSPAPAVERLLARVDTCPPLLRRPRDGLVAACLSLRRRALRDGPLIDPSHARLLSANGLVAAATLLLRGPSCFTLLHVAASFGHTLALLLCAGAAAQWRPRDAAVAASLDALVASQNDAAARRVLAHLTSCLARAGGEEAMLTAACDAVAALYPSASGSAAAAFAEGSDCGTISCLVIGSCGGAGGSAEACGGGGAAASEHGGWADALADSLPPDIGGPSHPRSSVRAACDLKSRSFGSLLDSAARDEAGAAAAAADGAASPVDGSGGRADFQTASPSPASFSDWEAASCGGLPSARSLTLPLVAGPRAVGFIRLSFSLYASQAGACESGWAHLRAVGEALSSAIFLNRAFALAPSSSDAAAAGGSHPRLSYTRHSGGGVGAAASQHAAAAAAHATAAPAPATAAPAPATAATVHQPHAQRERAPSSPMLLAGGGADDAASPGGAPRAWLGGGGGDTDDALLASLDASRSAGAHRRANFFCLDVSSLSADAKRRLPLELLHCATNSRGVGLITRFGLSPCALLKFVADVEQSMRPLPFHHVDHVRAVCHAAALFSPLSFVLFLFRNCSAADAPGSSRSCRSCTRAPSCWPAPGCGSTRRGGAHPRACARATPSPSSSRCGYLSASLTRVFTRVSH